MNKFLKGFLDLSSSIKLSSIDVKNHSHLTDMEFKKLIKSDLNKSKALAKKEAASSSSEALTSMILLSSSDYNIFGSKIADLIQDMLKGNNNYTRTVTTANDLLTHFELAYSRCHHTERT